jgi:hypothetical protein
LNDDAVGFGLCIQQLHAMNRQRLIGIRRQQRMMHRDAYAFAGARDRADVPR